MTRTVCGRCEMDKCQCKTIGATEMTREDIIRLAREAEQYADKFCSGIGDTGQHHWFDAYNERFAALVAAHEREACAKVCEEVGSRDAITNAWDAAAAIRSRGEVKP